MEYLSVKELVIFLNSKNYNQKFYFRKTHQDKLHDQLNQEAKERLIENKGKDQGDKKKKTNYSYKSQSSFPQGSVKKSEIEKFQLTTCCASISIIMPW